MATPAQTQAAAISALGAAPANTARVSLPGWSWLTDPRIAAIYEPFGRYGIYGNAIKQFALGTGSTGFGNQFGTGIIDTSIPEFNVDEGGGGDGSGDGGGGGGPSGGAGDIESGGGRGGQSSAGDVASGESGDPAHGGATAVGGAPDFSYSDRERAIDQGLDPSGRSTTDRDLAQGSTGGGTEVGGADPGASGAYAEGGIVTKPTRALIGEAGEPEAVIPQHMLDDPDTLMSLLRNLAKRSPLDDPGRKMTQRQRALWEALRG